jgi:RNA polymerase sigma-70 factor (ECF subfamily)
MNGRKEGRVAEASGNEQRFGSLYDAHRAALAAYCRRRVPGDVDDVMAEVFLAAWRRVEEIPNGAELPWLYGVARNVVANQRRSSGRRSRLAVRVGSQPADLAPEPAVAVLAADQPILDALSTLSASDQELLRLRAWEELSSAEMAVVLGITASAVDMRLSRARRRLERALAAFGSTGRSADAQIATEELS